MAKVRLDALLVERGLADSRSKAQALIMAGLVSVAGRRLEKPGQQVAADLAVEVKGKDHPWVSRGGVKLAHALDHFGLDVRERTALDIGASTGGFTDVLLQRGAAKVYAVDVGYGQLAWSLRENARVAVLERTNARHLDREQIPEPLDVVVCDASFISLRTVLPAGLALAKAGALLVALIKPQFEVGPGDVGKGGVVRNTAARQRAVDVIESWLGDDLGWEVVGVTPSPITGPAGNEEYLIAARKPAA